MTNVHLALHSIMPKRSGWTPQTWRTTPSVAQCLPRRARGSGNTRRPWWAIWARWPWRSGWEVRILATRWPRLPRCGANRGDRLHRREGSRGASRARKARGANRACLTRIARRPRWGTHRRRRRSWRWRWYRRWSRSWTGLKRIEATLALSHDSAHLLAHFLLPVVGIELKHTIQLAVAVIHDATSIPLTIFEGVLTSEIVTQLVGEGQPGALKVELIHTSVVARCAADGAQPGHSNGATARPTASEQMR